MKRLVGPAPLLLVAVLLGPGCGRSDLTVEVARAGTGPDGGEAGARDSQTPPNGCNAMTCASGCCDKSGSCLGGTELGACGAGGIACEDCTTAGFQQCLPNQHLCATQVRQCHQNCPNGCCEPSGGGGGGAFCVDGQHDVACGMEGQNCLNCQGQGQVCDASTRMCVAQACGPSNCAGCCVGGQCMAGNTASACGQLGQACASCAPPSTCSAGGCQGQNCGPSTCLGCCDQNGTCNSGFLDSECGSGGAACATCSQQGLICNIHTSPRACETAPCPVPYGGCPAGTTTRAPSIQSVCPPKDLQAVQAACQGTATSMPCTQFFAFEKQANPACYSCLVPFDQQIYDGTGIFLCVASCAGAACDGATGCATDCEDTSCIACPQGQVEPCRNEVRQNECASYFQQIQCAYNALSGACAFCDPQNYGFDVGAWLAAMGKHFCGQ